MRGRIIEICIGHDGESIGKHHLLNQTRQDKNDAALNHDRCRTPPELNLRNELPGPNDRTCNEMRKKRDEQRIVDNVSDSLHFSPIHIDGV